MAILKDRLPLVSDLLKNYQKPVEFNRQAMINNAVLQKIELKLYSTLGTSEMYKWLPEWGVRKGNLFIAGDQSIVLKTHKISKYSIIKEYKILNSLLKEGIEILSNASKMKKEKETNFSSSDIPISQCLIKAQKLFDNLIITHPYDKKHSEILYFGEIINAHTLNPIAINNINGPISNFYSCYDSPKSPLLEFYEQCNDISKETAITELVNLFDIKKDLVTLPKINKRNGIFEKREFHTSKIQFIDEFLIFNSKTNTFLFEISYFSGLRILEPTVYWSKRGAENKKAFKLPTSKRFPLFNLNFIEQNPNAIIVLTDQLYDANQRTNCLNIKDFIWTSFYGWKDGVSRVDWSPLKNRVVYYIIEKPQNIKEKEKYEMAFEIYKHLKNITSNLEFIDMKFDQNNKLKANYDISIESLIQKCKSYGINTDCIESKKSSTEKENNLFTLENQKELKEVEYLIEPIIQKGSLSLMYANPGVGKTWLALYLAACNTHKTTIFKRWNVNIPGKSLYIDCEMGKEGIMRRLKSISKSFIEKNSISENLFIKSVNKEFLDLAEEKDQGKIDKLIIEANKLGDIRKELTLVILDNLLALTGSESASSWKKLYVWLKELQENGISVIIIHHANKEGAQRGTDVKVASVDNVFRIQHEKASSRNALGMSIHIEKGRDIYGKNKEPIHVEFNPNSKQPKWKVLKPSKTIDNSKIENLIKSVMDSEDFDSMTDIQIAEAIGMNINTFKRDKKKLGFPIRNYKKTKNNLEKTNSEPSLTR